MSGPWSDLPPAPPERRERAINWRLLRRRGTREPLINNWRALALVVFLLFAAPLLVSWLAGVIMGLIQGH